MTPVQQEIIQHVEPIQMQQVTITPREAIETKIRAKFGKYGDYAVKIAQCESGMNPKAIGDLHLDNGTNPSYGLLQIRYFGGARGTVEQLLDVDYNINKAYEMSGGGTNWQPWSCSVII